jgi:MAC/Perforin domain/Hemopexin
MPGLEVVGRGIYLRPYQPYSLMRVLFPREKHRAILSAETQKSYSLPEGYEVNESPPLPVNTALNQVCIEESWDRFEKQGGLDANIAISKMPFSISATASWNNQVRAEQEAYYATRSSFVPLWSVYIPDTNTCIDAIRDPDIPVPFSHDHRRAYDEFFQHYGTHVVTRAWVGGKSTLVFTVLKSTQLAKEDIHAGIQVSFLKYGGGIGTKKDESRERLKRSSQCTVFGKGGDEVQLAAMSSLDEEAYNGWLKTIPDNPEVIELDVQGIWTLIRDPAKADALMEAYRESVAFIPITAAYHHRRNIYFVRGSDFILYDRDTKTAQPPQPVATALPGLEKEGFASIDAALRAPHLVSPEGERLDRKLFLFRYNRYLRFDLDKQQKDPGYPKLISEGWPGVTFERIDTVMMTSHDTIYFFYGNQYIRFNPLKNCADEGYPQLISKRWAGITFDRLDVAMYWGNGKAYFFKGDQHIRYDLANYRADPGYPKYIIGNYVQDWKFIDD